MKLNRLNDFGFTTWYGKAWELIHRFDINIEIDRHTFEDYCKKNLKTILHKIKCKSLMLLLKIQYLECIAQ